MRHWGYLVLITLVGCNQGLRSINTDSNASLFFDNPRKFSEALTICSELSFEGVPTIKNMSDTEMNSFALALNITGSFEGHDGWDNITNNFDGTGLSLGLLNQTLGTNSLQPLMLDFLTTDEIKMKHNFSNDNFQSLKTMLMNWKNQTTTNLFFEEAVSNLDKLFLTLDNKSAESVQWAKSHLYTDQNGQNFKPDWKKQLQDMANVMNYRFIQITEAIQYHERAKKFMERFQVSKLKSYLFLFDFVVQNGGFSANNFDFTKYNDFLADNPQATENQKLQKILDIRLKAVRPEFVEDVRARKSSLINGSGVVHGENRNYPVEYCYDNEP